MANVSNQYVAFLRAINVAGHAVVKMIDLRDAFASAGCQAVRTFIQSGNVVFQSSEKGAAAMFRRLPVKLCGLLGAEPVIIFRSVDELEQLLKADPFAAFDVAPDAKCYVTFLARAPQLRPTLPLVSAKEALEARIDKLDVFVVSGQKKNGTYAFPNSFIEKQLGVPATTRNWATLSRIVEFANQRS